MGDSPEIAKARRDMLAAGAQAGDAGVKAYQDTQARLAEYQKNLVGSMGLSGDAAARALAQNTINQPLLNRQADLTSAEGQFKVGLVNNTMSGNRYFDELNAALPAIAAARAAAGRGGGGGGGGGGTLKPKEATFQGVAGEMRGQALAAAGQKADTLSGIVSALKASQDQQAAQGHKIGAHFLDRQRVLTQMVGELDKLRQYRDAIRQQQGQQANAGKPVGAHNAMGGHQADAANPKAAFARLPGKLRGAIGDSSAFAFDRGGAEQAKAAAIAKTDQTLKDVQREIGARKKALERLAPNATVDVTSGTSTPSAAAAFPNLAAAVATRDKNAAAYRQVGAAKHAALSDLSAIQDTGPGQFALGDSKAFMQRLADAGVDMTKVDPYAVETWLGPAYDKGVISAEQARAIQAQHVDPGLAKRAKVDVPTLLRVKNDRNYQLAVKSIAQLHDNQQLSVDDAMFIGASRKDANKGVTAYRDTVDLWLQKRFLDTGHRHIYNVLKSEYLNNFPVRPKPTLTGSRNGPIPAQASGG